MERDEIVKDKIRQGCKNQLERITAACANLEALIDSPQRCQKISWEYTGALHKIEQELNALSELLLPMVDQAVMEEA